MKIHTRYRVAFISLLLLPWTATMSAIDIEIDVSTATNTPEAAVAAAIFDFCPKIQGYPNASDDTIELARVCQAIENAPATETEEAYRDLSARSATSILTMMTRGPGSQSVEVLDSRLAALRRAAANMTTAKFNMEFNGQQLPDSYVADLLNYASGGAASADSLGSKWSGFLTGTYTNSEQTETATLAGFEGDTASLVVGADYRIDNNSFAGVAARLLSSDVKLDDNAGSLDAFDTNITLYGTTYTGENIYVDGTVYYGHDRFDLERDLKFVVNNAITNEQVIVNDRANGDTIGNQVGASVGLGYDLVVGRSFVTQFSGKLRYGSAKIHAYEETNATGLNLNINKQEIDTTNFKLGASISNAFSFSWGVIAPQFDAFWIHEFITAGEKVTASFVADPFNTKFTFTTEDLDSDYFTASLGAVLMVPGGFTAFLQYETYIDYENYDQSMLSLGARMEF